MLALLKKLRVDLEFMNLIQKLGKVVVGLLGTLIVNAVIPFVYLRVQLIEKVHFIFDNCNIEDIL